MIVQFALFPPVARRYGSLPCLRLATFAFPIAYLLTPFTVLLRTSSSRQTAIFAVMLVKGFAAVFAYPCSTILMTNSARRIAVLGMLNGVAVSSSAVARALGPWSTGALFTAGVEAGYVVPAWWLLAAFGAAGWVSTWWLVEMDAGVAAKWEDGDGQANDEAIPLVGVHEDASALVGVVGDDGDERRGEDVELALGRTGGEDGARLEGESGAAATTSSRGAYLLPDGGVPPRMRSPMRTRGDARAGGRSVD